MEDSAHPINENPRISVSLNHPIALLVGVAGFIGSHLADKLLSEKIQVVGIDDFSTGDKINLAKASKSNFFHFLHRSIDGDLLNDSVVELISSLPRVDYIFFCVDSETPEKLYTYGLQNFLQLLKKIKEEQVKKQVDKDRHSSVKKISDASKQVIKDKPKVAFVSSINIYNNNLTESEEYLKEAEVKFAKFVKYYKFNARVIRLATVYGPRMHFRISDPMIRLIQSALTGQLEEQVTSLDFTTRALYIDDAISLIAKSILVGSTSNKIYDGALLQPIKISEVKQILIDPLWYETKGFQLTELPPWPTPNLNKTIKELAWKPKANLVKGLKETISYFKENEILVEKLSSNELKKEEQNWEDNPTPYISKDELKRWTFKEGGEEVGENKKEVMDGIRINGGNFFKKVVLAGTLFLIVFLGLIYPFLSLFVSGFNIKNNLSQARTAIEVGDFDRAEREVKNAKKTLNDSKKAIESLEILKRLGLLNNQLEGVEYIIGVSEEGISGIDHAVLGSNALYQATKVVSGENNVDPLPLYEQATIELKAAKDQIGSVKTVLSEDEISFNYPSFLKGRVEDLRVKINMFSDLVDKAYVSSILLPEITGVKAKKSYLILLQNNMELRPTGGFIGSYAKLDFDKGKIVNIKVDDIYSLDGGLKEIITPPSEILTDLNQTRLYLRDVNYEIDFPTSARQAELIFKKISGETVNGVIALNLSASAKLLGAVGGVDLPEYREHVNGENLFEKAVTHAEVNFFPGSQAKKNYLTALQNQLFNKVFYLSRQNWPAIIGAVSESLNQKEILIYLSDPVMFSYIDAENWGGVMPRGKQNVEGQTNDFLSVVESNMGANKANFYLSRKYNLQTGIDQNGNISHKLRIDYANNSPSEVFPAGKYKNRFKIYLPLGAKINQAWYGESDITSQMRSFSDYGRAGYSVLLTVNPKEQKSLNIDYSLSEQLSFKGDEAKYSLLVLKQPGIDKDPFEYQLTYPINLKVTQESQNQEIKVSTDLLVDRLFSFNFTK